ncbi:MAG: hypothetical protein R2828_25530 [Saprospiraceae bacterium]
MIIEAGNIEEFFLRILGKNDLFAHDKTGAINKLNSLYPQYQIANEIVFNETIKIIEETPQELIDLVRNSIIDAKSLTTTLANRDSLSKKEKTISDKMKFISVAYELASFFRLGSYLLGERKAPLDSLQSPQKIFKGYKKIGVDFNTDKLRQIRNATNHKFSIKGNWLIDKDDTKVMEISEIDEIYKKLEDCSSWYFNFLIYHSYFIPKFGLILLHTGYYEITENKKEYDDYYQGFKLVAPEVFERKKEEPPPKPVDNSLIGRAKSRLKDMLTIRFTTTIRLSKNKYHNKPLYRENLMKIEIHLNRQIDIFNQHLKDIQSKLNNSEDVKRILQTLDWVNDKRASWVNRIRQERIKK